MYCQWSWLRPHQGLCSAHPSRIANKGEAVRILCARYGIARDEVVAFGDDYNDFELMEYAGCSIAVANATAACKEKADDMCATNDEDGVAQWLKAHQNEFI